LKNKLVVSLVFSLLLLFIGYIFFDNLLLSGCLLLSLPYLMKLRFVNKKQKYENEILEQFQLALQSISSFVISGKSLLNAIKLTVRELQMQSEQGNAIILNGLYRIIETVENGETMERALNEFSITHKVEEIQQFVQLLSVCLKTGGNLPVLFKRTSALIHEKYEVNSEISVVIAQKKWEAGVMCIVPILFLAFMKWSSHDFFDPLYHGVGRLIMLGGLLVFILCQIWISKIVDIKV
jgi:tight adherence protein B